MGYHSGVDTPAKPPRNVSSLPSLDPALRRGSRLKFERRVTLLALAAGFPAVVLCAYLLWYDNYTGRVQWTIDLFLVLGWLGVSFNLKQRIVRPLQTLSNILAAIREGDFSIRGRHALTGDALGRSHAGSERSGSNLARAAPGRASKRPPCCARSWLRLTWPCFAFDGERRLRLVNRAGRKNCWRKPATRLLGRTSSELGLAPCLDREEGDGQHTMQMVFPGGVGRWDIRRSTFREGGAQHQLLVLTDLSQTLREEERTAWQRLLRVLGPRTE